MITADPPSDYLAMANISEDVARRLRDDGYLSDEVYHAVCAERGWRAEAAAET